jgi:hypothetical protein
MKFYVALMDNGSYEMIMHAICSTPEKALKVLQEAFLEWKDDEDDLEGIADRAAPTLEEMNERVPGHGANIYEVEDGHKLYEQLRNWEFDGCRSLLK